LILVTGGAGFIGSHLVEQLVEAGEAVRVLEEPGADVSHLPLDAIQLARGDIRRVLEVRDAVRECREVYHLAANPNLWTRVRTDFDAVNNEGTRNVLHEALRAGAQRILHTSTESILAYTQSSDQSVEELRLSDENMIEGLEMQTPDPFVPAGCRIQLGNSGSLFGDIGSLRTALSNRQTGHLDNIKNQVAGDGSRDNETNSRAFMPTGAPPSPAWQ
jgi:NAD dependent epimerase/dehydratase family